MDKKRVAVIGGLALAGLAAFFLLRGNEDPLTAGGSAYGPYAGYEGGGSGGAGVTYMFGGDTVNFPPPGQDGKIFSSLLPDLATLGDTSKKSSSSRILHAGEYEMTAAGKVRALDTGQEWTPLFTGSGGQTKKAEPASGSDLLGGIASLFGLGLGVVTAGPRSAVSGLSSLASIAGGSSGISAGSSGGSTIAAKKPFVSLPAGAITSYQSGGSGSVASYVQSQYGQAGSGYVIRGYSRTGVPLYKPAGS